MRSAFDARAIRACLCLLLLAACTQSRAESLTLAVAANFAPTMQALIAAYPAQSGVHLRMATGSSGKLYAQIRHGAPFHALFSADQAVPQALLNDGLAVSGSRFTYAVGSLVLWSARAEVEAGAALLRSGAFRRLALANPRLAPYGRAAEEVLRAFAQLDSRARWVVGENVAQAYQFVHSGNADAGLLARSLVLGEGRLPGGSVWPVPAELHAPIRQDAVVLLPGRDQPVLAGFIRFLASERARQIIQAHGYSLPREDG